MALLLTLLLILVRLVATCGINDRRTFIPFMYRFSRSLENAKLVDREPCLKDVILPFVGLQQAINFESINVGYLLKPNFTLRVSSDQVDRPGFSVASLRPYTAIVSQDTSTFKASVYNSIICGLFDTMWTEMITVVRSINVLEFAKTSLQK